MSILSKFFPARLLWFVATGLFGLQIASAEIFVAAGPLESGVKTVTLDFFEGPSDNDKRSAYPTDGSPWDVPATYELTKVGSNAPPLEITKVTTPGEEGVRTIHLHLKKSLEKADYELRIKDRLVLKRGGKEFTYNDPDKVHIIPKESIIIEMGYMDQIGFKNSAEFAKADEGTAFDFNLYTHGNTRHMFGADHLRYEARLKGQIGFDRDDRNVFADAWSAEYSLFARSRIGDLEDRWRIPVYYALSSTLEADRDFENIAGVTGAWVKLETARLGYHFLSLFDTINPFIDLNDPEEPAPLAPFWEFGYQFATTLDEDVGRVDYGDHRITGRLSWEFPLFRKVGPEAFLVNGDLVLAAQGIYHPDTNEFTDETKVSAVFRRDTDEENPLTFTITYQQGKASPTFENYDALLVGFRQFF